MTLQVLRNTVGDDAFFRILRKWASSTAAATGARPSSSSWPSASPARISTRSSTTWLFTAGQAGRARSGGGDCAHEPGTDERVRRRTAAHAALHATSRAAQALTAQPSRAGRVEGRLPAALDDARLPRPRRCRGSVSRRAEPWPVASTRPLDAGIGTDQRQAVGRVRALAGARLRDLEARQRGHHLDRAPRDRPARLGRLVDSIVAPCRLAPTSTRPAASCCSTHATFGGGSLPSPSWPSVGAGGAVPRPLLDHVAQPERRRPRDDDPAAHAAHRHVVRQRAADAPRPRAGSHHHVRGLDAAVVGQHARHVVAAAQQLAHGAARADLGARGARVLGECGGGRTRIDAARVEVEPAVLAVSGPAAARPRASSAGASTSPPFSPRIRQPCGSRSNANACAAALVQIQQQLERAPPDRLHGRAVRADHEPLVAPRGRLRQPGAPRTA